MRYFYTSGYANFRQAMRTFVRSTPRRRVMFHLRMWGLFVIGWLSAFLLLLLPSSKNSLRLLLLPLACGLIAGGAVPFLLRPWQMRRVYRTHNGDPKQPLDLYLEVDGETLISGIDGRSEGRFQRSSVCDTAEDNHFLLLLFNKCKFIYIPKAQLPTEAIEDIRTWLRLPGGANKC